jgi:cytochrome c553
VILARTHAAAAAAAFLFLAGAAEAADPNLCAACHGDGGNSTNPAVPSIAQQPAQFISTSLFMFREGNRKDPQMSPMAANLSNAEMNELAKFVAEQKAAPPKHKSSAASVQAGPELTKKFNCTQCHGAKLLGQQHIPRIAGQQFEYLKVQLRGFKAGTRADIDGNMTSAAEPLTEKDIEALTDYLAGLSAQ